MTSAVDPIAYRRVVGRYATGIALVTTALDGVQHGMTCNSLTSVSLEPVLVLFCAEKIARFHDAVLAAGTWAVSVLSAEQLELSRRFALRGRPLHGQFDDVPHRLGPRSGAVVVAGAVAALECRTLRTMDGGDHTVVLGEVLGADIPDVGGEPLLYYEGRYRGLAPGVA